MVFRSDLKTDEGTARMMHVTSLWRLRRVEAEDERVDAMSCIVPFYFKFAVFYELNRRDILVI
jgi:hypothetical protein